MMGEESWGKDLGLEKKKRGPMAWREEEDGGMGRLKGMEFQQNKKSPWDFGQNCKFAIGSTLGGRLMVHKNSEKLMNNF